MPKIAVDLFEKMGKTDRIRQLNAANDTANREAGRLLVEPARWPEQATPRSGEG